MKRKLVTYIKLTIYLCAFTVMYSAYEIGTEEAVYNETYVDMAEKVSGGTEIKKIALTFDDGPHSVYTEKLLDGLKSRGVVATFFIVGGNINGNEHIVKRMYEEGHLIGNHTYSHVELDKLSAAQAEDEIKKTNDIIESITGEEVNYIRPPFGAYNKSMFKDKNMFVVLWDLDPRDWCIQSCEPVVNYVVKNVKSGQIILMHDIFHSSVEAALKIVDILKEQGYEFVTVEDIVLE